VWSNLNPLGVFCLFVSFSEVIRLPKQKRYYDEPRLREVFDEDAAALRELELRVEQIKQACDLNAERSWAIAAFPVRWSYAVLLQLQKSEEGEWTGNLRAVDLSSCRQQGVELPFAAALKNRSFIEKQYDGDQGFIKSLRTAAFLCSLSDSVFAAQVSIGSPQIAGGLFADILCNALPPQHTRFVSAIAGTFNEAPIGFQFQVCAGSEGNGKVVSFADFTKSPATLRCRIEPLNFAQRTAKNLLGRLDLPFLLSMYNAAEKVVVESGGIAAAASGQDLIIWQMLQRNFPSLKFPITEEEHLALRKKVAQSLHKNITVS
jgi:hypothetical protein